MNLYLFLENWKFDFYIFGISNPISMERMTLVALDAATHSVLSLEKRKM